MKVVQKMLPLLLQIGHNWKSWMRVQFNVKGHLQCYKGDSKVCDKDVPKFLGGFGRGRHENRWSEDSVPDCFQLLKTEPSLHSGTYLQWLGPTCWPGGIQKTVVYL